MYPVSLTAIAIDLGIFGTFYLDLTKWDLYHSFKGLS